MTTGAGKADRWRVPTRELGMLRLDATPRPSQEEIDEAVRCLVKSRFSASVYAYNAENLVPLIRAAKERFTYLNLSDLEEKEVRRIFLQATHLRSLVVTCVRSTIQILAHQPRWRELTGLGFYNADKKTVQLTSTLWPPQLAELDIGNNGMNSWEVAAVVATLPLSLSLFSCINTDLGVAGCEALAQAKLPQLEKLDLSNSSFGVEGVRMLASGLFPSLKDLDLSAAFLGPEGIKVLVTASFISHLSKLSLSWNRMKGEGAKALAEAPWGPLESLKVGEHNELDLNGARGLIAMALKLPKLRTLHIGDYALTDNCYNWQVLFPPTVTREDPLDIYLNGWVEKDMYQPVVNVSTGVKVIR